MIDLLFGIFLIISGIYVLIYRWLVRRGTRSIEIVDVKKISTFECRGVGLYRYLVSYLLEGKIVEATSIEFSFYIHEMPSTNRTYEGLLCKNGKISLNGIYSREKIGLVVIFLGYLKVRMSLASLY